MKILRFLQSLLKTQPKNIILMFFSLFVSGVLDSLGIIMMVPVLDIVIGSGIGGSALSEKIDMIFTMLNIELSMASALSALIIIFVSKSIVLYYLKRLVINIKVVYEAGLQRELYRTFLDAEWIFFLRTKIGILSNMLTMEPARAGKAFWVTSELFACGATIIFYMGAGLLLSWKIATSVFVLSALSLFPLNFVLRRAYRIGRETTEANKEYQSEVLEGLTGIKIIKGTASEEFMVKRINRIINALLSLKFQAGINSNILHIFYQPLAVIVLSIILFVSIKYLSIPVSILFTFLFIFFRIIPLASQFQQRYNEALNNLPAVELISEVKQEAQKYIIKPTGNRFSHFTKRIQMKGVTYSYGEGEKPIIDDLSINISKGDMVAIVGSSGAGKSTVVDLLTGLIRPQKGEIYIDDVPLGNYDIVSWRKKIGYVAQDNMLFHDTVRANIGWADGNDDLDRIRKTAKIANADEFIMELSDGYDTVVGDRGVKLSGGQRQRIALARALYRDPEVLILDEATSALDAHSEKLVQDTIESLAHKLTIIIVSHRLSTIKKSDHIYVIEKGRVIESGNLKELLAKQGRFAELERIQRISG